MKYPWNYLHKHPILVILIAWNYKLRSWGYLPDEWYWADTKLLKKEIGLEISKREGKRDGIN